MNESEFRARLRDAANEFSLPTQLPDRVRRRIFKRRLYAVVPLVLVAAVASAAMNLAPRLAEQSPSDDPGLIPVAIELVDYYEEHDGGDADTGKQEPSQAAVMDHVDCMREQGFELPDPTRGEDGWMVFVDDPDALKVGTPEWREAAFVSCPLPPPPGPGDLIFGREILSEGEVETFRPCMSDQGFELPPAEATESHWRFDLSGINPDFTDPAWNRAVFVTCWPKGAP